MSLFIIPARISDLSPGTIFLLFNIIFQNLLWYQFSCGKLCPIWFVYKWYYWTLVQKRKFCRMKYCKLTSFLWEHWICWSFVQQCPPVLMRGDLVVLTGHFVNISFILFGVLSFAELCGVYAFLSCLEFRNSGKFSAMISLDIVPPDSNDPLLEHRFDGS